MIKIYIIKLFEVVIGLSAGLAVGAGYVAFLTLLGIIPRLIQLSKTEYLLKVYIACLIFGTLFGTFLTFSTITWQQPVLILVIWGTFQGIFNGMLAAALTEVLNVFPVLSKRVGMKDHLLLLLMAIVFGKIAGSLFQWVIFVR